MEILDKDLHQSLIKGHHLGLILFLNPAFKGLHQDSTKGHLLVSIKGHLLVLIKAHHLASTKAHHQDFQARQGARTLNQ
jgi:hypothetical protein